MASGIKHYTIFIKYEENEDGINKEGNREFYNYLQYDTSTQYGILKICHYNTQLYSCQVTELDGHRMTVPCPKWGYIKYRGHVDSDICFKYYIKTSLPYFLPHFLETKIGDNNGTKLRSAIRRLFKFVLLFEDEPEVKEFKIYVGCHSDKFDELVSQQESRQICDPSKRVVEVESKRLRDSYTLK